ncbi:MAG: peptide-methionine (S)-S-oxide reductase MsrA [Pirellulaceae bacterium]
MKLLMILVTSCLLSVCSSCEVDSIDADPLAANARQEEAESNKTVKEDMETATFATGCFWCTEAVFESLKGVESVESGYTGGKIDKPTYREVCSGRTGHAECVQIKYDPTVITFDKLLEIFFISHDPTTLNRQGYDVGTQYRSGIFYHTESQKTKAEEYIKKLNDANAFDSPIVTEVTAFSKFFPAEDYHQEYYAQNPNDRYCRMNAQPKVDKVKKLFAEWVKEKDNQ